MKEITLRLERTKNTETGLEAFQKALEKDKNIHSANLKSLKNFKKSDVNDALSYHNLLSRDSWLLGLKIALKCTRQMEEIVKLAIKQVDKKTDDAITVQIAHLPNSIVKQVKRLTYVQRREVIEFLKCKYNVSELKDLSFSFYFEGWHTIVNIFTTLYEQALDDISAVNYPIIAQYYNDNGIANCVSFEVTEKASLLPQIIKTIEFTSGIDLDETTLSLNIKHLRTSCIYGFGKYGYSYLQRKVVESYLGVSQVMGHKGKEETFTIKLFREAGEQLLEVKKYEDTYVGNEKMSSLAQAIANALCIYAVDLGITEILITSDLAPDIELVLNVETVHGGYKIIDIK
jgi:hypothetical protein